VKPENSVAISGPSIAPATDNEPSKKNEKKLQMTLEAGHAGTVVLRCQGRIMFRSEARALSSIVAEVLPSARRMVVDLAEIDSIDSGGLGELVLIHMWAEAAGYMMSFARPQKSLRHLFEITNLASVFDIYATVAEAMAAMVQEQIQPA
jgi:anti-sigma B factor antagonist